MKLVEGEDVMAECFKNLVIMGEMFGSFQKMLEFDENCFNHRLSFSFQYLMNALLFETSSQVTVSI